MSMFGYLLPDKQELKVKDLALYRAAYCGVCRAIKLAYGELPRLAVSYDAAVISVLLMGVTGTEPKAVKRRCVLNPVTRKPVFEGNDVLRYMAAVSVLLSWGRAKDAWADEKLLAALPAMAGLKLAVRKARREYPVPAALIEQSLADLAALEKAGCAEVDRPADVMGNLLSGIITSGPALNPAAKVLMRSMGYHLGRWVYFIDALDDRGRDRKSGAYNPILAAGGTGEAADIVSRSCEYSASQAAAVFDLTEACWGRDVISNVLYAGMPGIHEKVMNKEKAIDDRPVENAGSQAELQR